MKIQCQVKGELLAGSRIWDKVGGYYVPDHYIKTYTDGFISGSPRCAGAARRRPPRRRPAGTTPLPPGGDRAPAPPPPRRLRSGGCTGRRSASGR